MMKIVHSSVIRSDNPNYASKTFPFVSPLSDGRILCGFRAAPAKASEYPQFSLVCCSDDGGKTFGALSEPFKAFEYDNRPGQVRGIFCREFGGELVAVLMWVDQSHPELPFYNPDNEGLKDCVIFMAKSGDGGRTWGAPRRVPTNPITSPTPITGMPIPLDEGRLMIPFEVNKSYYESGEWIHRSCAVFYDGRDFSDAVVITGESGKFYWDQRLTKLSGDRLIDVFWSFDGGTQRYIDVHAKLSEDGGRTWGELFSLGMPGQPGYGAYVNGVFYLPVIDREREPQIILYASKDLRNYEKALTVYRSGLRRQTADNVDMEGAWDEMGKFSVGHPQAVALDDGQLLVYFYAGEATDRTDIRVVRIDVD